MTSIDFHEENEYRIKSRQRLGGYDGPMMEKFLIDKKIVSTREQATFVLLGVLVLLVGILVLLIYSPGAKIPDSIIAPDGTKYTPEEYIELVGQRKDPFDTNNEI